MKQKIAFKNYFYRFNFYFTSWYLTRYRTDWSCKDHTLEFQNLMLRPLKYAQYDFWKCCFFGNCCSSLGLEFRFKDSLASSSVGCFLSMNFRICAFPLAPQQGMSVSVRGLMVVNTLVLNLSFCSISSVNPRPLHDYILLTPGKSGSWHQQPFFIS